MYAATILVSAIHAHLCPTGTVTGTETETETEIEIETVIATETTTDAVKDAKGHRVLLANAAEPTASDSKVLSFISRYLGINKTPHSSGATYRFYVLHFS